MSQRHAIKSIAINATAGQAPEWVEVLPKGPAIAGRDGRAWTLSDPSAFVARSAANRPLHVDYEHASEILAPKGGEAPAAGWIEALEVRDGAVWARVAWTTKAADRIANREYRFLSPVFTFDAASREIHALVSVGLTNRPNLDMVALNREEPDPTAQTQETPRMDKEQLKALCRKLGLADEASADAILSAVDTLKTQMQTAVNAAATPPLEKFVPRADYDAVKLKAETAETALNRITAEKTEAEVTALVDDAVKAGKVAPASKDFYLAMCRKGGVEEFKKFVATAPVLTGSSGLDKRPPGDKPADGELTADEKAMCTRMGLSEEAFKKAKAA